MRFIEPEIEQERALEEDCSRWREMPRRYSRRSSAKRVSSSPNSVPSALARFSRRDRIDAAGLASRSFDTFHGGAHDIRNSADLSVMPEFVVCRTLPAPDSRSASSATVQTNLGRMLSCNGRPPCVDKSY